MQIKDKRKRSESPDIDQKLIAQGTRQLSVEIETLENWLKDLEEADNKEPAVSEARNAYLDMLRSRREMLQALQEAQK